MSDKLVAKRMRTCKTCTFPSKCEIYRYQQKKQTPEEFMEWLTIPCTGLSGETNG